ncbi:MAE_28990/MAE_18760 family HEPN-like nuclease [Salinicola endophyticus]|uniref:MAE_28990/MAE_18760 family HEPN-like nuclease n=1 Tax=Salinicola endophyticus TaxID=1949083 RepID=UPI001300497C|nr:MAE_28990/MAE_18760 family HEPN-like nuclease [Salinicola endophyticus]
MSSFQLNEVLNAEIAWRKKEIISVRKAVEGGGGRSGPILRASMLILYAHWEGFIKKCSEMYLCYVQCKRLPLSELGANFQALVYRQTFSSGLSDKGVSQWVRMAEHFRQCSNKRVNIPWQGVLDVHGNLSSVEFFKVCQLVGINYRDDWKSKELKIDGALVGVRNSIAHGEFCKIEYEDYLEVEGLVVDLISSFKNEIENSAIMGGYRA